MQLNLEQVAEALSVLSVGVQGDVTSVSTDTRSIRPGALFFALRGENFDGNQYAAEAKAKGAVAVVADTLTDGLEDCTLVVPDTTLAYGQLARLWRSRFTLPVIAVTGSVGKTTMKEMISLALAPLGDILKSSKNENNEIGVPQTLIRLESHHRAAVIEMGMRGHGQIRYLADIALPTVGVITMIGESHIEMVGSRDGIARAKGELLESLSTDAVAVINADDPYAERLATRTSAKIMTYGTTASADIRINEPAQHGNAWRLQISYGSETARMTVHSPAHHDVLNAAGAIAVALSAGVTFFDAVAQIELYRPSEMRMQVVKSRVGASIINDCYNAAPSSMKSALKTLAEFPSSGKKLAFLGDMRELGSYAEEYHLDVAKAATGYGIKEIYAVGELMPSAIPNAEGRFLQSSDAADFAAKKLHLREGDVVLVKGSRALQMERIVNVLVEL